jgi:hypothetical protein
MVDPSVADTMEGKLNYGCVGDHATQGSAPKRDQSRRSPEATTQITLQFYAFGCLASNLRVSQA